MRLRNSPLNLTRLNAVISKVEGSLSHHSAESYASVARSSSQIAQARISSPLSGNLMPTYASRSRKLILFGLPEHNTLAKLKNEINKILSFLVGSHVPLSDLYHLGCNYLSISSKTCVVDLYLTDGQASCVITCVQAERV